MILLPFNNQCIEAEFIQRYKRFSIEVSFRGKTLWAHTNNTGSMLGLLRPGQKVWLSRAKNPNRKLPYTLELVRIHDMWVGVNTLTPNRILKKAWEMNHIPELESFDHFSSEVTYGDSRFDTCVSNKDTKLWIEAKNVTLVEDDVAAFPDAITTRGQKHLQTLTQMRQSGLNTALFFLVQRSDAQCFAPADYVDPQYAKLFYAAISEGVQIWVYQANISQSGIGLGDMLPVIYKRF